MISEDDRESPAVVIDVKRLRSINACTLLPFGKIDYRLRCAVRLALTAASPEAWEPSDFNEKFIYWYLDRKRRDGAIKTHRGHFYFVSGKRHKIRMPSSLRYGRARAGEKNFIIA